MSAQGQDSIVNTIRHLLALAQDAGATQPEAELAMERAQAMLLKHNLAVADIEQRTGSAPQGVGKLDLDFDGGSSDWRQRLVNVLALGNLCKTVRSGDKISVFGRADNVRVVVSLYLWLVEQLEPLQIQAKGEYTGDRHGFTRQWWCGAAQAIHERLQAALRVAAPDTRALMIRNETALDAAIRKVYPHLVSRRRSVSQGAAYQAGAAAGRGASLSRPGRLSGGYLALGSGR